MATNRQANSSAFSIVRQGIGLDRFMGGDGDHEEQDALGRIARSDGDTGELRSYVL